MKEIKLDQNIEGTKIVENQKNNIKIKYLWITGIISHISVVCILFIFTIPFQLSEAFLNPAGAFFFGVSGVIYIVLLKDTLEKTKNLSFLYYLYFPLFLLLFGGTFIFQLMLVGLRQFF